MAAGGQAAMQALLGADPDDLDTQALFFFSRERLESG